MPSRKEKHSSSGKQRRAVPNKGPQVTRALGIHGWWDLDPLILAALSTRMPVLLVGSHGTGKTLLVERLAGALDLTFRHYNASLLNYDDLVGIPVPREGGGSLDFVSTPGSIWEAGFVFFDEISRCRPDLQNKMFPIVHERRVAGIQLEKLRHRWAAMNPPAGDEIVTSAPGGDVYLGSEALDPALADRFPFVIQVPGWPELSLDDRRSVVNGVVGNGDDPSGRSIPDLVAECEDMLRVHAATTGESLAEYVLHLMDRLGKGGLPQSPRRARMLHRAVLAVQAASIVLVGPDADLEWSTWLAVQHGLPQNAAEEPPALLKVRAAHRQAWGLAKMGKDDAWWKVLRVRTREGRVKKAHELGLSDEEVSLLITQALESQPDAQARRRLATAIFLAFRDKRDLTPAVWEPLVDLAAPVLEPRRIRGDFPGPGAKPAHHSSRTQVDTGDFARLKRMRTGLERNYLVAGFPGAWRESGWEDDLKSMKSVMKLFSRIRSGADGTARR